METISLINMISAAVLNILLIVFFVYAFIWFKGISAKIDKIEEGVTSVYKEVTPVLLKISSVAEDIPPVLAKISDIAEDISGITSVSKRTVHKGENLANELFDKGKNLVNTISMVEDRTSAAYNNVTNLISALRAGVRTFGLKIKR
ncbi:MAG: hypothetical protein IAE90_11710 [Ignavibacteria bacterium]|nr:hypothetical protein [Ignavibacteria bacterium]